MKDLVKFWASGSLDISPHKAHGGPNDPVWPARPVPAPAGYRQSRSMEDPATAERRFPAANIQSAWQRSRGNAATEAPPQRIVVSTRRFGIAMQESTAKRPSLTHSDFQQTCGFCGCVFRVEITWPISFSYKASQETQAYSCPECQRDLRIRTATAPLLTLIARRTDGRTGSCPRT